MKTKNKFFIISLAIIIILLSTISFGVISTKPRPAITVLFSEPVDPATITKSLINLNLSKEYLLDAVVIDNKNMNFKYVPVENLPEGNYKFTITAKDVYGNLGSTITQDFIEKVEGLNITLIDPQFGVSSKTLFDLKIGTSRDAKCRYSTFDISFTNMDPFDSTNAMLHIKNNFGMESDALLFVRCNDSYPGRGIITKTFNIILDTTQPKINEIYAFPNPIVQDPLKTTLFAKTDEDSICKYSLSNVPYAEMESKFIGADLFAFKQTNNATLTFQNTGPTASYNYFVQCMNKGGLYSNTSNITIALDLTKILLITKVNTPSFSPTNNILLDIETNKNADCFKGTSANPFETKFTVTEFLKHTLQLTNLDFGSYSYLATCISPGEKVNTTINFTIGECALKGDLPKDGVCNGCVDSMELAKYVDKWLKDEIDSVTLAKIIDNWINKGC